MNNDIQYKIIQLNDSYYTETQYNDSLQKDYALWQHYGSIHNYCQHNESGLMTFNIICSYVPPSRPFLICYIMLNVVIVNVVSPYVIL
jgi:hypothetical protein